MVTHSKLRTHNVEGISQIWKFEVGWIKELYLEATQTEEIFWGTIERYRIGSPKEYR
jgi:hypothetical protein